MSPASSTDKSRGVYVQKPKSDIYTVLLIISAVAVLIGILFLYLEIGSYSQMSPSQLGMTSPDAWRAWMGTSSELGTEVVRDGTLQITTA